MCRHLAHLGPPTTLAALLLEPPHGLLHQSYAPADMRGGGTVNADGFGAGWYPPADPGGNGHAPEPARYRSAEPIWSDGSFASLAAATRSAAVLAAVRSATVGMPVTSTAAAPFTEGRWLFSHNGVVRGWPRSVADLAGRLPVVDLLTLDAPTDAALLWALVRHRLRAGEDPARVLSATVLAVEAAAPHSRLNLLLTDGTTLWGTAWDHALSVRVTDATATVASEPTDADPGWQPVPDRHLVVAAPGRLERHPIGPVVVPTPGAPGSTSDSASDSTAGRASDSTAGRASDSTAGRASDSTAGRATATDTGIPDRGTRAPHP
ncbi:ergothioneine biosynthesis protein EgtC [Pseudonocardia kujensis]|uniref:ergothioneine biosynthesis protein EgtC n=1 Tax=Pseudonocardia kujensis TaxID=1128675 RepID=UPI0035564822